MCSDVPIDGIPPGRICPCNDRGARAVIATPLAEGSGFGFDASGCLIRIREVFEAYYAGRLSTEEQDSVDRHCGRCHECRSTMEANLERKDDETAALIIEIGDALECGEEPRTPEEFGRALARWCELDSPVRPPHDPCLPLRPGGPREGRANPSSNGEPAGEPEADFGGLPKQHHDPVALLAASSAV